MRNFCRERNCSHAEATCDVTAYGSLLSRHLVHNDRRDGAIHTSCYSTGLCLPEQRLCDLQPVAPVRTSAAFDRSKLYLS